MTTLTINMSPDDPMQSRSKKCRLHVADRNTQTSSGLPLGEAAEDRALLQNYRALMPWPRRQTTDTGHQGGPTAPRGVPAAVGGAEGFPVRAPSSARPQHRNEVSRTVGGPAGRRPAPAPGPSCMAVVPAAWGHSPGWPWALCSSNPPALADFPTAKTSSSLSRRWHRMAEVAAAACDRVLPNFK